MTGKRVVVRHHAIMFLFSAFLEGCSKNETFEVYLQTALLSSADWMLRTFDASARKFSEMVSSQTALLQSADCVLRDITAGARGLC
jgi:hypothetical protein